MSSHCLWDKAQALTWYVRLPWPGFFLSIQFHSSKSCVLNFMLQEIKTFTSSSGCYGSSCFAIIYLFFFWPHHAACWILVPWPGIKPVPPALEVRSLNHWTQGSPQEFMLWYRHSFSSLRLRCSTFPISFWRKHSYLSRLNWVSSSGVLPWSASFGEVTPPCALLLVCLLFHGTWLNVLKFSHFILVFLIRPVYLQGKSTFKVIFESPGFGEYSEMCSMTFTEINSNKC